MKKNKFFIVYIILFIILLVGITYAFFDYFKIGQKNYQIITGQVYLNFVEGIDSVSLIKVFPETKEEARARNDNTLTFTINGKNQTTNKDIWYEIRLNEGDSINGKSRLKPEDLVFDLIEIIDNEEHYVVNAGSFNSLNAQRIWINTVDANTNNEIEITYRLRMWLSDKVLISDTEIADYTTSEFSNSYASVRVSVYGDFEEKHMPIYGVRRNVDTSSTGWERVGDAKFLTANATKDGNNAVNDFDEIYPWSHIKSYNYDAVDQKIRAWYGDGDFAFDGSNGLVMTYIPEFYYKRYVENNYEYIYISEFPADGYVKSEAFSLGRYESSYINGRISSRSGTFPKASQNITWFRTQSRALGQGFGQLDYRYFILQLLYLVEYADYDSQSVLGMGETGYRQSDDDVAVVSENGVNRIIINNTGANAFDVGQVIGIGSGNNWSNSVAVNRIITKKEAYDANNMAVYFDGGPINVVTGSILHTSAQKSGKCDSLGMKSGSPNSGYRNCVIYRGIENIFGNIYKFVDGINIKDYRAYICKDPSQYAANVFTAPYQMINYPLTTASVNFYIKKIGYDGNNQEISLPIETGGSSSSYISDYYYLESGNRIAMAGGYWGSAGTAGLWFWSLDTVSSYTNIHIGSRLLLDHN